MLKTGLNYSSFDNVVLQQAICSLYGFHPYEINILSIATNYLNSFMT